MDVLKGDFRRMFERNKINDVTRLFIRFQLIQRKLFLPKVYLAQGNSETSKVSFVNDCPVRPMIYTSF